MNHSPFNSKHLEKDVVIISLLRLKNTEEFVHLSKNCTGLCLQKACFSVAFLQSKKLLNICAFRYVATQVRGSDPGTQCKMMLQR